MLRFLGYASCSLALACGSTSNSPPGGGGAASSGGNDAGQGGASAGASAAGGVAGASPHGGAGADGCAVTFGGVDEPMFEQATHRFRAYAGSYWMTFNGAAFDAPAPSFHEEAERQGFCRLLTYEPSFCDPACSDGKICFDGACVANPAPISAGALELRGAGDSAIDLEPNEVGHYYWSTEDFGYDAVDVIAVSATGDVAPAFELSACLVEPPEPTRDWSMLMEARGDTEDIVLSWSNPLPSARFYLRMTTGIGTHGGISPVEVECEGPDRGSLTIPGAYLDALYAEGWSCGECGGNELFRYHAERTGKGTDTIELRAESGATFWFRP